MLVFWFSALAIGAVTKAAVNVIKEVRRQFQADPGILKGTSKPDYGRAVDIVTIGALKEMVAPGLLAVGMPIAIGLVFKGFHVGAETVAAFLMVGTIDRKSTRLNSSHLVISYAVFCLKKKKQQ